MLTAARSYLPDFLSYHRRPTREVMVGRVGVGGDNPIRIQSMTTTLTKDVDATVAQAARLVAAGCEIVRVTTPTPADARCLGPIKARLAEIGIDVPIVADIHFSPAAAMAAAELADKVRVNPGNYTDSRKFAIREYSDEQYETELARVEERFTPLVLACKERGIAMRIGTNHGSLSDRIMNRFGDTPQGMVESALEFVRVCERYDYRSLILSMKASNPKVMIAAYRLLAARMGELGMDYPFHLGVTEAGNAEDGRIKSAIGIGSLLEDGIGDTIRVSLTEEPEAEIPVAFALAAPYRSRIPDPEPLQPETVPWNPFEYERRPSTAAALGDIVVGQVNTVAVLANIDDIQAPDTMARVLRWASPAGKRQPKPDAAVMRVETGKHLEVLRRIRERLQRWPQARLNLIASSDDPTLLIDALPFVDGVMLFQPQAMVVPLAAACADAGVALILQAHVDDESEVRPVLESLLANAIDASSAGALAVLGVRCSADQRIHAYRLLTILIYRSSLDAPIVLEADGTGDALLGSSVTLGSLLCDGIGDAVALTDSPDSTTLAFNILQGAGVRFSKTDYVACPSCGRTLFDLQETTERIKQKTSHLVGVRLAIMGCIVNGPGEMADADFGYVGGAPGQVNLYVGKQCVEKGVPAEEADERLVALIKAHGKWQEEEEED